MQRMREESEMVRETMIAGKILLAALLLCLAGCSKPEVQCEVTVDTQWRPLVHVRNTEPVSDLEDVLIEINYDAGDAKYSAMIDRIPVGQGSHSLFREFAKKNGQRFDYETKKINNIRVSVAKPGRRPRSFDFRANDIW